MGIERRMARAGTSGALKDVVSRCVGEYNRMVTKKSHRIETGIKSMIMNLPFSCYSAGTSSSGFL